MDARSPSGAPNCLAPAPVLAYCEMDAAEDEFAEDDQYIADIMAGVKRSEDPEPTTPQPAEASATPTKPVRGEDGHEQGRALLRQFGSLDDIIRSSKPSQSQKRKGLFSPQMKTMRKTSPTGGGTDVDMSRFVKETAVDLQEPKVDLLRRCIEILGMTMFRAVLHEVQEVEESGGQWTAQGDRRRTPGGVFWNLLKQKVSKEDYTNIFAEEKEKERERNKKRQKERNLKETLKLTGRRQLAERVGGVSQSSARTPQDSPHTPTAVPSPSTSTSGRMWSAVVRPVEP